MPGDVSEIRGLITIVSFLGLVFLLISMIPNDFYDTSDYSGIEVNVPEFFEGIDIQYFAQVWNYQCNQTGGYGYMEHYIVPIAEGDFGGHQIDFVYSEANKTHHEINSIHIYYIYWIIPYDHAQTFAFQAEDRGVVLTGDQIDLDMNGAGAVSYTVSCDHLQYQLSIGYNTTDWDSVIDAWDHHELYVMAGIGFDDVNTSTNAWGIISALLLFQTPDIHPVINGIIAIPLWIGIAYLIYVLILKAIPLVSG